MLLGHSHAPFVCYSKQRNSLTTGASSELSVSNGQVRQLSLWEVWVPGEMSQVRHPRVLTEASNVPWISGCGLHTSDLSVLSGLLLVYRMCALTLLLFVNASISPKK